MLESMVTTKVQRKLQWRQLSDNSKVQRWCKGVTTVAARVGGSGGGGGGGGRRRGRETKGKEENELEVTTVESTIMTSTTNVQ